MTLTNIVLDANVLFTAFMKEGTTRKILLTKTPTPLKLYTPPFLLDEVYKYKELLARKAMLPERLTEMLMQARQLKDDYLRNGFKKEDEERVYAAYDKAYSEIRKYLAKEKHDKGE